MYNRLSHRPCRVCGSLGSGGGVGGGGGQVGKPLSERRTLSPDPLPKHGKLGTF